MSPNRNLASSAQAPQQSAFTLNGPASFSMVEEFNVTKRFGVAGVGINRQRTLANRRTHNFRSHARAYIFVQTKPLHARCRQNDGIVFARLELAQPRIHIAAKRKYLQIRTQSF